MLVRAGSGRIWAFDNDNAEIIYSDDEGQNWIDSSGLLVDLSTAWHIAAHPTDSNRVALSYDDGSASPSRATVEVTIDGGGSWTKRTITAVGAQVFTVWLPNGRLVAFVFDVVDDDLYTAYSDDDGATWTVPSLLINGVTPTNLSLQDVRVTNDGYIFGLVTRGALNINGFRSSDGASFELLSNHDTARAHALAYDESTGDLYISYETDRIFQVPGAQTIAAASWVSGASELTGVPAGVAPVGTRHANMGVW